MGGLSNVDDYNFIVSQEVFDELQEILDREYDEKDYPKLRALMQAQSIWKEDN